MYAIHEKVPMYGIHEKVPMYGIHEKVFMSGIHEKVPMGSMQRFLWDRIVLFSSNSFQLPVTHQNLKFS